MQQHTYGQGYSGVFEWVSLVEACSSNHRSAVASREVVKMYLDAECVAGRLVGPFSLTDLQAVHISPIGLVPKSQPNQWRLIVDLS